MKWFCDPASTCCRGHVSRKVYFGKFASEALPHEIGKH